MIPGSLTPLKTEWEKTWTAFPKNFGRGFFQQLEYFIHVRQKLIYTMNQGYSGVHMVEEVGSLGGGRGI